MATKVDQRYLNSLLSSAGKAIAQQPGAKTVVTQMKTTTTPQDFAALLHNLDLGIGDAARSVIYDAAANEQKWREAHAMLVRSLEQQLVDRFSSSS